MNSIVDHANVKRAGTGAGAQVTRRSRAGIRGANRNERFAQLLAYLSPYIFWSTLCVLTGGIWLLQ